MTDKEDWFTSRGLPMADAFREEVIKERSELMAENARFRMALEVIKAAATENSASARSVATIALFPPGED